MGNIMIAGKPLASLKKPGLPTAPSPYGKLAASPTSGTVGNVSYQGINPADDLRSKTLSVAPTANRNQIAQNNIATWEKASQPYFQADARTVTGNGAASGQLGSGQLRTKLGDLALNQGIQHDAAVAGFLNDAQTGSIDDAYRDVGVAQQQQGRQDAAANTSFNQTLSALQAGYGGNPSGAQLGAAQIAGDSANAAGGALSGLITNTTANNAAQNSTSAYDAWLKRLGIGGPQVPTTPIAGAGGYGVLS